MLSSNKYYTIHPLASSPSYVHLTLEHKLTLATQSVYCRPNDEQTYLKLIGKVLSKVLFGNELQLECLAIACHKGCRFIAFTNIGKNGKDALYQGFGSAKLRVIEAMFLHFGPRNEQRMFGDQPERLSAKELR